MLERLLEIDGNILLWIQDNIRNDVLTPIVKFITSLGNAGMIWIAITIVLLMFKKTRKLGGICALSLIASLVINNFVLKNLVARVRPYDKISQLNLIIEKQKDWSFPSGHTGSSFACAWAIFRNSPKKYGVPAIILATLIALSRLYVGVHFPSDVLAGVVTGVLSSYIGQFVFEKIYEKVKDAKK